MVVQSPGGGIGARPPGGFGRPPGGWPPGGRPPVAWQPPTPSPPPPTGIPPAPSAPAAPTGTGASPRIPGLGVGIGVGISILQELLFPPPAAAPTLEDMGIAPHGSTQPTGGTPPFAGGQMPVPYFVDVEFQPRPGDPFQQEVLGGGGLVGPLSNLYLYLDSNVNITADRQGFPEVSGVARGGKFRFYATTGTGTANEAQFVQEFGRTGIFEKGTARFLGLRRVDGQPDTGGDPPAAPGTATPPTPQPNRPPPRALPGGSDNSDPVAPPAPAYPGPQVAPGLNRPPAIEPDTPLAFPSPIADLGLETPTLPDSPTEPRTDEPGQEPETPTNSWTFTGDQIKIQRPGLTGLSPSGPSVATEEEEEEEEKKDRPFIFFPSEENLDLAGPANQFPPIIPPPVNGGGAPPRDPCKQGCNAKLLNNQDSLLQKLDALSNVPTLALLTKIDAKLGPQIGDATKGISGFIQGTWQALQVDRALSIINTLFLWHNVLMLSRAAKDSLLDAASFVTAAIGFKDENGSPFDFNQWFGESIESWMGNLIGDEEYEALKARWLRWNNIINSASRVVWTVRSIFDSAFEMQEWVLENTGKIGNALKRFRVVGPNAYPWMSESARGEHRYRRWFHRVRDGVDNINDAADSVTMVAGEALEIQEEFGELNEQTDRFRQQMAEAQSQQRPDNQPMLQRRQAEDAASVGQDTQVSDRVPGLTQ